MTGQYSSALLRVGGSAKSGKDRRLYKCFRLAYGHHHSVSGARRVIEYRSLLLCVTLPASNMFRKKKRPVISMPTNFEHRVHTGFDRREGRYVGLPPQWASIIQVAPEDTSRPKPIVDPSNITPTEILDLKMHVRVF